MPTEKDAAIEKKCYKSPELAILGDVEAITLGDDLGEDLDAAFTTGLGPAVKGSKKPKKDPGFS